MKKIISQSLLLVMICGITYQLFAQDQSWLDKFLPKKTPMVLSDTAQQKPLIEPPKEVVNLQDSFVKVAALVKPATINISAVQIEKIKEDPYQFFYGDPDEFLRRYFGQPQRPKEREYRREGTGSGVIIDPEGYILTNNHVVQGADQLTVTLENGKTLKGVTIGTDPRTDLAVIKIKRNEPFPYVPLGDSSKMRIGDWVLAVGSPFGLEQTVTAGIISAIRQSLNIEGRMFNNLLQTDAAINRGNSGGPLVNLRGEVIGINSAIYAPTGVFSGIGFAIPVNEAKKIIKDLIDKGFVERSWIGVEIAEINDVVAQQFELDSVEGALVNKVVAGSPAEKGGLNRGDVILEVNAKKVKTVQDLQSTISGIAPKTTLKIKVMRDGKSRVLTVVTEIMPRESDDLSPRRPLSEKESSRTEWLGGTFADASADIKQRFGIEDRSPGVIALKIPVDSLAAEIGFQEGDLVRSINKITVDKTSVLESIEKKIDLKRGIVADVCREGRWFYLTYRSLQ